MLKIARHQLGNQLGEVVQYWILEKLLSLTIRLSPVVDAPINCTTVNDGQILNITCYVRYWWLPLGCRSCFMIATSCLKLASSAWVRSLALLTRCSDHSITDMFTRNNTCDVASSPQHPVDEACPSVPHLSIGPTVALSGLV